MEKTINRLLVFTLIAAVGFGALTWHFRNAEHDSAYHEERIITLCEYIDVDVKKLSVTVIPYDGEAISAAYTSDRPLSFKMGDNKLFITESSEFMISLFAGNGSRHELKLYLPQTVFREISVYSGTGNVNIGRVDSSSITVLTNTGNISCGEMISRGSLSTSSGHISVNFDHVVSGTDIYSRSGDVDLKFPEKSSVTVDFETETGKCNTDMWNGAVSGSFSYGFNGGSKTITANLVSGVLNIYEKGKD